MNKVVTGMLIGVAVGIAIANVPKVKEVIDKGKKKAKNLTK